MVDLDNVDDVVSATDVVMIDRGDLSVETNIENLAIYQKRIIETARTYSRPVIVATEMLHTRLRIRSPPAEVSDISNTVLDGAAATMLSGETAVGAHLVAAASTMRQVSNVCARPSAVSQGSDVVELWTRSRSPSARRFRCYAARYLLPKSSSHSRGLRHKSSPVNCRDSLILAVSNDRSPHAVQHHSRNHGRLRGHSLCPYEHRTHSLCGSNCLATRIARRHGHDFSHCPGLSQVREQDEHDRDPRCWRIGRNAFLETALTTGCRSEIGRYRPYRCNPCGWAWAGLGTVPAFPVTCNKPQALAIVSALKLCTFCLAVRRMLTRNENRILFMSKQSDWSDDASGRRITLSLSLRRAPLSEALYPRRIDPIANVPGDIVDAGAFKGASTLQFAHALQAYQPNSRTRVLAFDTFEESSRIPRR